MTNLYKLCEIVKKNNKIPLRFVKRRGIFYNIYMNLFNTIKKGEFLNYGKPERVITTLLSWVFLFEDKVIKIYKKEKAFYGDFTDFNFRKKFYNNDFFENHFMSPDIYLRLVGIKENEFGFQECEEEEAIDFFIEMKRVNDSQTLTTKLINSELSVDNIVSISKHIIERINELTKSQRNDFQYIFDKGWFSLQNDNLDNLRNWGYLVEQYVSREETDEIIDLMKKVVVRESYFKNYDPDNLSVVIDNNCDNLLWLDNKLKFIDISLPIENWKVADDYFIISRLAVDCYVLGNKELGDKVYEIYFRYKKDFPEYVTLLYEIRSAFIHWIYRHILEQHDIADKYQKFTLDKFDKLKSIYT